MERDRAMKPQRMTLLFFILIYVLSLTGCASFNQRQVKKAVSSEFSQLKKLDPDTVQKYLASESLFPDADVSTAQSSSASIEETTVKFFESFNYKIQKISVQGTAADCKMAITTLDAQTLAKDYRRKYLANAILSIANGEASPDDSLEQCYALLGELMAKNTYGTVSNSCTIHLALVDGNWMVKKSPELEDMLVGGLISELANPNLLTPSETVDTYFQTLKEMDISQMENYLGLADTINSSDADSQALMNALLEQVHTCFTYRIISSSHNGIRATADTEITSFSDDDILSKYQQKLDEYLATPDAVVAGSEGRLAKSNELLLSCIENNTATESKTVLLTLTNDGQGWILESNDSIGQALFGDFSSGYSE